jgi:hypothetical protein
VIGDPSVLAAPELLIVHVPRGKALPSSSAVGRIINQKNMPTAVITMSATMNRLIVVTSRIDLL